MKNKKIIIYHGEQKNIIPFFEMANCIIHPSYYPEGMSNVLLESCAHARPIICTNRSGCKEIVSDEKTGFIVPIKNTEAVIAAVKRFMKLSNKEMCEMGLAGRKKVEKEFDRELVVKEYLRLISRKALIGKAIGFAPMICLFVGYLIIPLVVIGLSSMSGAFSGMQTSIM